MSQDLLTQLAAYGTYCDERQGPVLADDVIDAIVPLPMPVPPTAPRRGWIIAIAAAALILIVVGGMTWLTSFNDSIAPADEPTQTTIAQTTVPATPDTTVPEPSTTAAVAPTTIPTPTVATPRAAESVTWTRREGILPSGEGFSYKETPVGLMAIQRVDFQVPMVYVSPNGVEWTEVPLPAGANLPLPEADTSDAFDVDPTESGIWLSTTDNLWFADLESWAAGDPSWEGIVSATDLLELKGPPPLGTRWAPGISGKARIGATSLVAVEWELTIDYEAILDLPPGYTDIRHDDLDSCYSGGTPGQLSVRGRDSSGAEVCLTTVTMVSEAGGVSVLDDNGTQVAHIENAVAEFAYGSGGPHIFRDGGVLDLYASTDGQVELVRSIDDASYPCTHELDRVDGAVVHIIDCRNTAMSTTDGVTWVDVPRPEETQVVRHPLGFLWESTWPWGPPDDKQGPPAVLVSQDGEAWTVLVRQSGPVVDIPGGLVVTQFDEEGDLVEEIVVYNGELTSTVQVDWPVGSWPEFLGAIGDTLILINGADVWVGEVFEG